MKFETASEIINYSKAGKAIITLHSLKTDKHYTYKVTKGRKDPARPDEVYFVSLMISSDEFHYVGIISKDGFKTSRNSANEPLPIKAFNYMWDYANKGEIPKSLEVMHEGFCGKCMRRLTTPDSIISGIGPECLKKMSCS